MNLTLWHEMADLGETLVKDPDLRALVVIGNGRSFSAGIDLGGMTTDNKLFAVAGAGPPADAGDDPFVAAIARLQDAYRWLPEAPYPTIAAVRGHALGGGLQLALACDLRVVARGTKLSLPEHRYGIVPDLGGAYFLPRLVGAGKAKELIWTNATFDAEEAHRLGLVERLVDDADLESEVSALAATLAAQPPLAVAAAKRLIDGAADVDLTAHLEAVARAQSACVRSADFVEAVSAFAAKRPPVYQGR